MGETWPDRDVDFEDARSTRQNAVRWQQAIDEAIVAGTLQVVPTEHRNTFELEGDCPRCGHTWASPVTLYYGVKGGPGPGDSFDEDPADPLDDRRRETSFALEDWHRSLSAAGVSGTFNIPCSCSRDHGGGAAAGCGWSRDIAVQVDIP